MSSVKNKCFHCDENIPKNLNINAEINQNSVDFCCYGCKAVAEFINQQGCDDFYSYRGEAKPASKAEVTDDRWLKYDEGLNFDSSTKHLKEDVYDITLRVEGLYCSACGWLIDKHISKLDGVNEVRLNTITKLLHINFKAQVIKLSQILSAINNLGYQPVLAQDNSHSDQELKERKSFLKRLLVAGIGMMQVMTMSVPLYSDSYIIEPNIKRFFELVSLLVATSVFFYSGKYFLKNAWRDLSNKHLGMDVPVALSITLAYVASCWNVFSGLNATIYFDSMIMFIFFLLAGRYIEMSVRHRGMSSKEALSTMIPNSVKRISNNEIQAVPLSEIQKGDVLQINSGETIPCDGNIIYGECTIDESLLTGESISINKLITDSVMAGSIVQSGSIQIESTAIGGDTLLAGLSEMLDRAQLQKPKTLLLVDKTAVWFVATVLIIALVTGIFYSIYQADIALSIVLSVLVATCPCALSLATPTALTAATVGLMKKGVLVNQLDALTKLDKIKHWFFDKTGTLTEANMSVVKIHNYSDFKEQMLLTIMATLEHISSHPIASAFIDYFDSSLVANDYLEAHGQGVQATINQKEWKAGKDLWCLSDSQQPQIKAQTTVVYLSCNHILVCIFEVESQLRKDAQAVISNLQHSNKQINILSGDKKQAVTNTASSLGVKNYYSEQSPQQKINRIRKLQSNAKATVMVGDGVNDAPVLAQSDVSISFNQGTHLARSASDIILMGNSLSGIASVLQSSKKTNTIIKQNIIWALVYNISVTPLAIMGYLTPWMAAIGMSLSSLMVVLNARRLLKIKQ